MIVIHVLTLAQEIGVHRNTIRNWVKTGRISAKPGPGKGLRFTPEDFARLCREFNLDPEQIKTMARSRPGADVPPLARPASPPAPRGQDRPGKVVGGGIAGIQAALDLADSGYYVYLGIVFAHPYSFLTADCFFRGGQSMSENFEPVILGFLCNWCAYAGADLAGVSRLQYPPNLRVIRANCSGMVHPNLVVHALSKGMDGVLVMG